MVTRILIIIDQIYMMASKVPHSLTKKRETFEYTPDSEDAQMILGMTSLLYYWMSVKFVKAMAKE